MGEKCRWGKRCSVRSGDCRVQGAANTLTVTFYDFPNHQARYEQLSSQGQRQDKLRAFTLLITGVLFWSIFGRQSIEGVGEVRLYHVVEHLHVYLIFIVQPLLSEQPRVFLSVEQGAS